MVDKCPEYHENAWPYHGRYELAKYMGLHDLERERAKKKMLGTYNMSKCFKSAANLIEDDRASTSLISLNLRKLLI